MPNPITVATSHREDQDFFTDTQKLLALLVKLNRAARPIFDERSQQAIDMVRIRWDEPGGVLLGEIADIVLRNARRCGRRWNPATKTWDQGR